MLLPKNSLTDLYEKPRVFLCETDKTRICPLETSNMKGAFKFNAYSTLSFDVARIYNDIITGEAKVNPYYDKIEAIRLAELDGFGYFELQDPEINGDGIKETKTLQAYSLEYTLSQKYLELFKVNKGSVDSLEVMYASDHDIDEIVPITFYNPNNPELSLLNLVLEKAYGWTIDHVDASLWTMSRQFEVDRESIYDFIMNEICDKFNCYAVFNTFENKISFYAETLTNKFYGDGETNTFIVSPVFADIDTVSVDGYKTINYSYDNHTGELILGTTPKSGAIIEVTDGSLSTWETDVYVTFDNLAEEMNISYSSDDIKTVLTVVGADDMHIREVNSGLPYIVDLSYFYNVDWMGEDLYDEYTKYLSLCTSLQEEYKENAKEILRINGEILHEENRLSLGYVRASVSSETIGTYYLRGGDESSGYTYEEVVLSGDNYDANAIYYTTKGSNVNENKIKNLFEALQAYFKVYFSSKAGIGTNGTVGDMTKFTGENSTLANEFSFTEDECEHERYTYSDLVDALSAGGEASELENTIWPFLDRVWYELGLSPLDNLYYKPYKKVQTANVSAGMASEDHADYGLYFPVTIMLKSLEQSMRERQRIINNLEEEQAPFNERNADIGAELLIENNFSDEEMIRLSAFLREDEYMDDNFLETGLESIDELFQLKQELLECGRIELSKISSPALKFSMSLANIYALPEFAPIMNKFQLGNLIKVALRDDYIKHTRLMEVNLNFEDFSDFSCEFGDLSSIRSQSDLHADLLSGAVSAGKTVASNASYWSSGADTATSTDIKIQNGLLDAVESLKSMDGTQDIDISKYGIKLQKIDPNTGEIDPHQTWMTNNSIVMSSDGFKTARLGLGEFTINGQDQYGLMADFMMAGYIEGSEIVGGTIQIGKRPDGKYNFEVDENGIITMIGGSAIDSNGDVVSLDYYNTNVEVTASSSTIGAGVQNATLTCRVFSYGTDITNTKISKFSWIRITGNEAADSEWNSAHIYERQLDDISNECMITIEDFTINGSVVDTAFFQCEATIDYDDEPKPKTSRSIAITANNFAVNIFTFKPDSLMSDGYYYHAGDLWVIGSDYQPTCYEIINRSPICGKMEHTHTHGCYDAEGNLICSIEAHTHTDDCRDADGNLICGKEEHAHVHSCYDSNGNIVCTIEEHVHDGDCFEEPTPIYDCSENHTHTNECNKVKYQQNTILVCEVDQTVGYSDTDWTESAYHSQTFGDLNDWRDLMQEHVKIKSDGLHLIGSENNGVKFEAVLASGELGFYRNANGQFNEKLVWIGAKPEEKIYEQTHVVDLGVENYINVQSKEINRHPYIQLGDFKLQVEDDGGLSLV